MSLIKKGDLVWLPGEVMLLQFNQAAGTEFVSRWKYTERPMNVLLVDEDAEDDPYYRVLCDGETWHVRKSDVYSLEGEDT